MAGQIMTLKDFDPAMQRKIKKAVCDYVKRLLALYLEDRFQAWRGDDRIDCPKCGKKQILGYHYKNCEWVHTDGSSCDFKFPNEWRPANPYIFREVFSALDKAKANVDFLRKFGINVEEAFFPLNKKVQK